MEKMSMTWVEFTSPCAFIFTSLFFKGWFPIMICFISFGNRVGHHYHSGFRDERWWTQGYCHDRCYGGWPPLSMPRGIPSQRFTRKPSSRLFPPLLWPTRTPARQSCWKIFPRENIPTETCTQPPRQESTCGHGYPRITTDPYRK